MVLLPISLLILSSVFIGEAQYNWVNYGGDDDHTRFVDILLPGGLNTFRPVWKTAVPSWEKDAFWEPLASDNNIFTLGRKSGLITKFDGFTGNVLQSGRVSFGEVGRQYSQPFISEDNSLLLLRSCSKATGLSFHAISTDTLTQVWKTDLDNETCDNFSGLYGDVASDTESLAHFRSGNKLYTVALLSGAILYTTTTRSGLPILGQALLDDSRVIVSLPGGISDVDFHKSSIPANGEVIFDWALNGSNWVPVIDRMNSAVISTTWAFEETHIVLSSDLYFSENRSFSHNWDTQSVPVYDSVRAQVPAVSRDGFFLVCLFDFTTICKGDLITGENARSYNTPEAKVLQSEPIVTPDYLFGMIEGGVVGIEMSTNNGFYIDDAIERDVSASSFAMMGDKIILVDSIAGQVVLLEMVRVEPPTVAPDLTTDVTTSAPVVTTSGDQVAPSNNDAAIVGGIVGGFLALSVAVNAFFTYREWQRRKNHAAHDKEPLTMQKLEAGRQ